MKSIKTVLFFFGSFILFGIAFSSAQTVYITDKFEVTMRTGPNVENKIIAMLPTGIKLQVIEEKGEWLLVQTPIGREGWVLKRYASMEIPKKMIIEQLQNNYEIALKNLEIETEKALTFEKENKRLNAALNTSQEELKKVGRDYTRLIDDSKDFLNLKKKHTKNLADFKKATAELAQLRKENKALQSSTKIRWFLSGAAVVIVSWLIGYVMGKVKRRSRSHSLYR
jgi:SH3 domain protein